MNRSTLRSTAVLLALFTLNQASAQEEYSPNRWKETQRFNLKEEPVHYADTVFVNTTDRQAIDVVIGGYAYRGTVARDSLNIGSRTFHVVKNEEGELRLKYGKLIHVFTREPKGTIGADATDFAEQNRVPDAPLSKLNLKQLHGTWLVYKKNMREGADADVKNIPYFKKLELYKTTGKGKQQGAKGHMIVASNIAWKVAAIKGGEIGLLTTLNQPVTVKVLRHTPNELLIEDEYKVVYFLKKH